MRKIRHLILGCLVTLGVVALTAACPSAAAPSPVAPDTNADLAAYLSAVAVDQNIPGMAAAVVTPDATRFEWLNGDDGNGAPIRPDTPFLIGSVAKSMTAALIVQRVNRGELALSEPISNHLPWLADASPTVEQLLTHTSGYSTADGLAVAERFDNTDGAVRHAAEDLEHSGTRGRYEYSDANYLILGALIEELDGRPFGEALRSDLVEPLGMHHTATTSEAAANLSAGHRYWWGTPRSHSSGFDDSGTPYGYVASTLDDMVRYARAQNGGAPDVLSPDALRQLHDPRVDAGDDEYGYGWRITPSDLGPLVHHTGATPGYFAHVMLGPEGQAVVILANAYSEAKAPALASIAENLLLILDGRSPTAAGADPLLTALPSLVSTLAALGLVIAIASWWRPARRGLRWTMAAAAIVIIGALWLLPSLFGINLRVMRIWMPDAAIMLIASLITWSLAAALLILPARFAIGRSRTQPPPASATGQQCLQSTAHD
ncbi:serine hydrolase domain-containing protein [Williamsia soli]|uniref:serine hydrolase domain-containing protein n=1 Tax=Williamsia soli TaxID=364929 RepID=UPI001A9E05C3|nr:serine hydrolase domain-containing protein [Williamsia soli]